MKVRSGLATADDEPHDENRSASMKRDEQQVADLISHLQEKMINPFDIQQPPLESSNVSTGLKVSTEVQESLLKSVDTGNDMVKTFVGSALSVGKSGSFYGPIKRSNIYEQEDEAKMLIRTVSTGKHQSRTYISSCINTEMMYLWKNYSLSLLDPYRLPCSTMTAPWENVSRLILLMNLNVRYVHLSVFLHLTKHLQF